MRVLVVVCQLILVALLTVVLTEELPHVKDCSLCKECIVDEDPPRVKVTHLDLHPWNFQPTDTHEKQKKPECAKCRGCTHSLKLLTGSGKKALFGTFFKDEAGASPQWLFVAPTNRTKEGKAIVKVACIPIGKTKAAKIPVCFPDHAARFAKIYLATEQLAEECGLTDVVPKVWVEPISAIIPDVGYHIRWHAMWMEQAEGVSLENLVRLGDPFMHPNDLLNILHDKLNKTQVVHAAIFDLLTSQCDRHAQNIFIDQEGGLTLIDNERAFFENHHCGVDSILLPTTKKYVINVMENAWVHKFKNWGDKVPKCWANPPLLFDYRCYVPGGKIGTDYPPQVMSCLQRLDKMSADDILKEYELPSMIEAEALKNRSSAMLHQGFEGALTHGWPRNPNPLRYKFTPPCCKIKHTDTYRCAHDWEPDTAIPFGDPNTGGPWRHDRPDLGTYEGGAVF